MTSTTLLRSAAAVSLLLLLAGCGNESDSPEAQDPASSSASDAGTVANGADAAASLTLEDPYVKAAESGMTAAFGTLVNNGTEDVTLVSATSDVATAMELHETIADGSGSMVMQPKEGGFVIPAGASHELAPGGDHLMVMDLTRPLQPGEDVTLTLVLADGSTTDVVVTVKDVTGADEEYLGGTDTGDMDMGSDDASGTPSP